MKQCFYFENNIIILGIFNFGVLVIVSHKAIREFCIKNPAWQQALEKWYKETAACDWSNFSDIKKTFNSVDSVGNGLFVFNIAGNNCRLVARIFFKKRTLFIRFVGTHKQYDHIDISTL
ncbi:type II toxin-antitoxin system HigB family toxin [Dyadobacter sp. CY327]|uniref:type II toxin-antitoxin system HigB family toxin n=1 Tax=Dyadobacter sp. CY327 TaxID=2907301 RepID=UPI00286E3471|nr:type II toxin-antitoxin system HigB family toxin [Dyadobacter sp. CY327]